MEIRNRSNLNKMLLEGRPVLEGNDGIVAVDYFMYGRVFVKPVYIDTKNRIIRRVGDVIYCSCVEGKTKEEMLRRICKKDTLFREIREEYVKSFGIEKFPDMPVVGGIDEQYVIFDGKRLKLDCYKSFKNVINIEEGRVTICYTRDDKISKIYYNWQLKMLSKLIKESIERISKRIDFGDYKPVVKRGIGLIFSVDPHASKQIILPLEMFSLGKEEMDAIIQFGILCVMYGNDIDRITVEYPYLFEITYYIVRKCGLHFLPGSQRSSNTWYFSDGALANMGKPFAKCIKQIIEGGYVDNYKYNTPGLMGRDDPEFSWPK